MNILYIILLYSFTQIHYSGQSQILDGSQYDSIKPKDIMIDYFKLQAPVKSISTLVKKADSASIVKGDLSDYTDTVLHYGSSSIIISLNKLYGFELFDNSIKLYSNNVNIKIGDHYSKLKSLFPKSFLAIYKSGNNETILKVYVTQLDEYILFVSKDGDKISNIITWQP